MKVKCIYNDPDNVPKGITSDFNYGLLKKKEYLVMGIMTNSQGLYYLIDENGKPDLYPSELFEITIHELPSTWCFKAYSRNEDIYPYIQAVWGYRELVYNEDHYEQLVDRNSEAIRLYFMRKQESEMTFTND